MMEREAEAERKRQELASPQEKLQEQPSGQVSVRQRLPLSPSYATFAGEALRSTIDSEETFYVTIVARCASRPPSVKKNIA